MRRLIPPYTYRNRNHLSIHRQVDSQNIRNRVITQIFSSNNTQDYVFQIGKYIKKRNEAFDISRATNDILYHFLPKGYPASVDNGYRYYIRGQFIGVVFSSAGGVLSIQSLLFAMGLGTESLPLASTLNWVIKDGLGQLGGVLFASVVSNKFDADPKKWRLISSISLDASSFIELCTPLFPGYFLVLASIANTGKNISYLAASASRAALHKSFAIHENLADITAKSGSQTILASLLGTGLGISIATVIGNSYPVMFGTFLTFSTIHLLSTYYSLTNVTVTTLNNSRFDYIFHQFCLHNNSQQPHVLSPREVNQAEVGLSVPNLQLCPLHIGPDLNQAIHNPEELSALLLEFQQDKYILVARVLRGIPVVYFLLKEDAHLADLMLGLCHAYFARKLMSKKYDYESTSVIQKLRLKMFPYGGGTNDSFTSTSTSTSTLSLDIVQEARKQLQPLIVISFLEACKASKWTIETLMLETRVARIRVTDNISK